MSRWTAIDIGLGLAVVIVVIAVGLSQGQVSAGSPGVTGGNPAGGSIVSGTVGQPAVFTTATALGSSPLYIDASKYGGLTQAAINATASGGVLDMTGVTTTQTLAASLTFSNPITVKGCNVTISEALAADPGQSSGGIVVATDHFDFEGASLACTITRPNTSPVENLIYSGNHSDVAFRHVTIDGNEVNQTYVDNNTTYFTGWHSAGSGGGDSLFFEYSYITGGGARGIDWRGVTNYHINHNKFFKTGYQVGGAGIAKGNSVSVDVGFSGVFIFSYGGECIDNVVDIQGDSFKCGNYYYKVDGLTIFGAAYNLATPFRAAGNGMEPWYTETGLDATGAVGASIKGVFIYDTYNSPLNMNAVSDGSVINPINDTISNSVFYADSTLISYGYYGNGTNNAPASSTFTITDAGLAGQLSGITLTNSRFSGVPALIRNVQGFSQSGNVHDGVAQSAWGILAGTMTYVSGASACTNGSQVVTFTNGTLGFKATGTITVSGNVPTGTVTLTSGGNNYLAGVPPTQGTVATCTGTATFSGGTVTGTSLAVTFGGALLANYQSTDVIRNATTAYSVESTATSAGVCSLSIADIDTAVTNKITYAGSSTVCNTLTLKGFTSYACNGVATSSVTIDLFPGQMATTGCSSTSTTGTPMGSHVFKNLWCTSNAGGVNASSGVVALYDAGSATALTCTFGTALNCHDTTHSVTSAAAGDEIAIRFTTQAAEVLSTVRCSVEMY